MDKNKIFVTAVIVAGTLVLGFAMFYGDDNELDVEKAENRELREYTMEEVEEHNDEESCWLVINNYVYDLTEFAHRHTGGAEPILEDCGTDATERFEERHGTPRHEAVLEEYKVGELEH